MSLIVTSDYALQQVEPPALPFATPVYNEQYQNQLNNVLRLYFNRLNNIINQLQTGSGSIDGSGLRLPYGAFSSNQSQSTPANTATVMTLNTTDFSYDVGLDIGSKIKVTKAGIYNLQFSIQAQNSDTQLHDMSIWLKQNGTDITGSTGFISIPNSHGGVDGHGIYGWNYYLSMAADDYVQLYWSVTNTAVTIPFYAASTGPTRPSTQSVVATLTFVSALP